MEAMRDLVKEQKELYKQVKEAGLKPFLVVWCEKEGTISFIPIGNKNKEEFYIVWEDKGSAVRVDRMSAEALLLYLIENA
jgi:hypothetical protein